jgi:hypothetical protein
MFCGEADFLRPWLGGTNRPNIAELNFADQYRDDFALVPANSGEANEINHVATAWFKYTCMKNRSYRLAANDPFSTVHKRINCVTFTQALDAGDIKQELENVTLYPKPIDDVVYFDVLEQLVETGSIPN